MATAETSKIKRLKRQRHSAATDPSNTLPSANPSICSPLVKDVSWSKAEGFDLRWDKPKIYKCELSSKDLNDVPLVKEAQKHICKEKMLREKHPPDDLEKIQTVKSKALRKMRKASSIIDEHKRNAKFPKVDGWLYQVVFLGGHFEEEEADEVVDFYLQCREREGIHPLQRSRIRGARVNACSPDTYLLFMHQPLRDALLRKGFYLNIGYFSSAESLTLMKNFESFLLQTGLSTDKKYVWKCLSDDFNRFHKKTNVFNYIGDNLNRSSHQLYRHLVQLYHPFQRGSFNAATDAVLLEKSTSLRAMGYHPVHKALEPVVDRHRGAVCKRLEYLTGIYDASTKNNPKIYEAIYEHISGLESNAEAIPYESIGANLGLDPEAVEKFWLKVGKQRYERSVLPKWTLKDSYTLLNEIRKSGEEDENAIEFGDIKKRCFEGKVVSLQHLRDHFTRIRRTVPYYMLCDLQSVVLTAKKEIEKKMRERNEEEEDDTDGS